MKKPENAIKEYVNKLNDDNLQFMHSRLSQRLFGDLAELLQFIGQSELDKCFGSAKNIDELYELLDVLQKYVDKECDRKFDMSNIR